MGKGGVDTTPSDERSAPAPPPHLQAQDESLANEVQDRLSLAGLGIDATAEGGKKGTKKGAEKGKPKLLPRETGEDIGMGSPVPLSAEAVGVITRLRNMKVCAFPPCRFLYPFPLSSGPLSLVFSIHFVVLSPFFLPFPPINLSDNGN